MGPGGWLGSPVLVAAASLSVSGRFGIAGLFGIGILGDLGL